MTAIERRSQESYLGLAVPFVAGRPPSAGSLKSGHQDPELHATSLAWRLAHHG